MTLKDREPLSSFALYYLTKGFIIDPVMGLYFRIKIMGAEKVPRSGGFIVVSNHGSYVDPPFLACSLNRPIAFMAKEELFRVPILKQVISTYGAYPVKRGASDRSALRSAMNALEEGWGVGIFLEGTRTKDGKVHHPKLGASLIASKMQVPLLPVCIHGTHQIMQNRKFPHPVSLTVRIGDLIDPPANSDRTTLESLTQDCATIINTLHSLN